MIPKVIHYFWLGDNPLPEADKKNIETWKKYCPDYEIKLWNEKNYEIPDVPYIQQAFAMKKWGHVPDYARLDILYRYGGIYFDTDVELVKPLDDLLTLHGFLGFESETKINIGQGAGCEAGNTVIKAIRDEYNNLSFLNEDGTCDLTPSPDINTVPLVELGLKQNNTFQVINDMTIFPTEYFCPKHILTGKITTTPNTYSIHHFAGSWFEPKKKKKMQRSEKIRNIFGMRLGNVIIAAIVKAGAIKNKILGK